MSTAWPGVPAPELTPPPFDVVVQPPLPLPPTPFVVLVDVEAFDDDDVVVAFVCDDETDDRCFGFSNS